MPIAAMASPSWRNCSTYKQRKSNELAAIIARAEEPSSLGRRSRVRSQLTDAGHKQSAIFADAPSVMKRCAQVPV